MDLDLSILPLECVENLVKQKCLISKSKFPKNLYPGCWAKCRIVSKQSEKLEDHFGICQIFPRAECNDNVCYLDASVHSLKQVQGDRVIYKLTRLECLQLPIKQVKAIDLNVYLIPEVYISKFHLITKSYLRQILQILLQNFHLHDTCYIRSSELLECGIDSIKIIGGTDNDDREMEFFIINDQCLINLKECFIKSKQICEPCLELKTYTQVQQELNEFMNLVQLQRSQKVSLRIPLNLLVRGATGCGKTALLETWLKDQQCNVFRITSLQIVQPLPGDSEIQIRKIFQAAINFEKHFKSKGATVIFLEDLHLWYTDLGKNSKSIPSSLGELFLQIDQLFRMGQEIMCLATTSSSEKFDKFETEITMNPFTKADERIQVIAQLLSESIPSISLSPSLLELTAKQARGYTVADFKLLADNVAYSLLAKSGKSLEFILEDHLRKASFFKPFALTNSEVTAYKPTESFDTIGGINHLKKVLNASILAGLKHVDAFSRFGLQLPKGILLYGPPGCAKTTIAKSLANEACMTFIATSGAEVYSPYIGCAEKFIAKLFDAARKNTPCMIFLDEIDTLVGRRSISSSTTGSSDVQMRILSTLLTEMDGIVSANTDSYILVVAATNRPDMIDEALMRPGRFDKLLHVPVPDFETRNLIFQLCSKRMPFDSDLNLESLASRTGNFSGADICNLCNEAAMRAFQRNLCSTEIQSEDFEYVLSETKSSLTQQQIDWYYQFESKYFQR
uniref:AAA+ ATPase domain-containing protein n=1 Tax=Glossina palpalis gambiensis TaxID=67801 RepID=A0A1B0AQ84_9MUSC